ncbi:type II secretion system F family protein [Streptomyces mashuensis]|nr:type II secretion system F family protein [Streptomyces mashuensis]
MFVHSLWAVVLVVLAALAVWCVRAAAAGAGGAGATGGRGRHRRTVRRRAAALLDRTTPVARPRARQRRIDALTEGRRGAVLVCGAGLLLGGMLGGVLGGVAGAGAGWGVRRRWLRAQAERRAAREAPAEVVQQQLPLAADLLAACLAAGAGPREAAEAVGVSLGGPVGAGLARAAAEVRLGGDPAVAWGRLGSLPGAGAPARCLERAQATGVPAVEPMARLADRLRAAQARSAAVRARRAGVLATAPLGLCFLPAFLAVGVVPVVVGLGGGLMKGG